MTACAETHNLTRVAQVVPTREITAFESGWIDQHLFWLWRGFSGQGRDVWNQVLIILCNLETHLAPSLRNSLVHDGFQRFPPSYSIFGLTSEQFVLIDPVDPASDGRARCQPLVI